MADLGVYSLAHGVTLVGWGTAAICILWWRCRPGMLGLISWLCHGHLQAFFGLSLSSANVLAVLLSGSVVILWCWMMGTELLQWWELGWECPVLVPWTRSLAVTITGWTKSIIGVVILCYPTCDDVALLLNGIPVSFTPAWNVRAEMFRLLLFEASLEKAAWGCFTHSLVSDGF